MKSKLFSLALGVMLLMASVAQARSPKVQASATSGTVSIDFVSYDDYSAELTMPLGGVVIDMANDIVFHVVAGTKNVTRTIETGVPAGFPQYTTVSFQDDFDEFYDFAGATIPVTVYANETSESFTYTITGMDAAGKIAATCNKDEARAAFDLAKTKTTRSTQSGNASVLVKAGSYIRFGNERMDFNNDVNFSRVSGDNFDHILQLISENTTIREPGIMNSETYVAEIVLIAGSTVTARGRQMVLNEDATITFDFSEAYTSGDKDGVLGTLKEYADAGNRTEFGWTLVRFLNGMAADLSGKTATLEIRFKEIQWDEIRGAESTVIANDHALAYGEIGTFCSTATILQTRGGVVYSIEYRKDDAEDNPISLHLVEAKYPLVAGRPYVFVASSTALEGVFDDDEASMDSHKGLVAASEDGYVPVGKYLIYQNELRRCAANCAIKTGLAYIDMTAVPLYQGEVLAPGRHLQIGKHGAPTDLGDINTEAGVEKVLVDGQILIIRGGHVFTPTGVQIQ